MAYTPEQWADEQASRTPDLPWADESRRRVVKPWWNQLKENPFVLPEMTARDILEAVWLERQYIEAQFGRKPKVAAALRALSILGIPCTSVNLVEEKRIERWLGRLDREGRDMRVYLGAQRELLPPRILALDDATDAEKIEKTLKEAKDQLIKELAAVVQTVKDQLAADEKQFDDDIAENANETQIDFDKAKIVKDLELIDTFEKGLFLLLLVLSAILESAAEGLLDMAQWSEGSLFALPIYGTWEELPNFVTQNRIFTRARAQEIYMRINPPNDVNASGWKFDAKNEFLPHKVNGKVLVPPLLKKVNQLIDALKGNTDYVGDIVVVVFGPVTRGKYFDFYKKGKFEELRAKVHFMSLNPMPLTTELTKWVARWATLGCGAIFATEGSQGSSLPTIEPKGDALAIAVAALVPGLVRDLSEYPVSPLDVKDAISVDDSYTEGSIVLEHECIFATYWPVITGLLGGYYSLNKNKRWMLPRAFGPSDPDHISASSFSYGLDGKDAKAVGEIVASTKILVAKLVKTVNDVISDDYLKKIDALWEDPAKKTKLNKDWVAIMSKSYGAEWIAYRQFLSLTVPVFSLATNVQLETDPGGTNFANCIDPLTGYVLAPAGGKP